MTPFQQQLEQNYQAQPVNDPLSKLRGKAWDLFQSMGLPSKQQEVWRSIKLRKLYEKTPILAGSLSLNQELIAPHVLPGFEKRHLVFANGRFCADHSCYEEIGDRMVISLLGQASLTYGGFLNHAWTKSVNEETDPFAVLNTALSAEGVFLYLPPKTVISEPLQIISIQDSKENVLIQPRLHIFAGRESELTLVSTTHIISSGNVCNAAWEISIEEGAHVALYQLNHQLPDKHWHLESVRAQLKRDSRFKTVHVTNGSETVRTDYKVSLLGENSEADLSGLWMLQDHREAHTNIVIDHRAPHCRSNQMYKGVLNHFSRSSFEGKIFVRQAAQKTDAFQLNNNLLLSEGANAFSKPNLEIFADDVKASHGATVGQLNKEHLFYLKTRGYSHDAAQKILVRGFYHEILELITIPEVREKVRKDLEKGC
jgi:Fe-S cluster assembly protein SufD